MEAIVQAQASAVERRPAFGGKAIWISWEHHRRTRELSRVLGAELFEVTSTLPQILKYGGLLLRTMLCVMRERPSILIIQCPSFVLGLWVVMLKPFFRYRLVADLHTEAVRPFILSFPFYRTFLAHIRRRADLCLVSNAGLRAVVEESGGRALVLPDKVPQLPAGEAPADADGPSRQVVFVCTYARDEPYLEVLEAARALGPGVTVHVTGNPRSAEHPLQPPPSVRLTGFLPEADYVQMLRDADVVIDLTAIEDCLVCGAYEAVAMEKPLITSDTRALRQYFRRGTVYTKHDSRSLAEAITYALKHRQRLAAEMKTLKRELARTWERQLNAVRDALRREERP